MRNEPDGEPVIGFIIPVEGSKNEFAIGIGRRVGIISWDGKSPKAKLLRIALEVEKSERYKTNRFNDAKADPTGRFYGGTMRLEECGDIFDAAEGSFYKYAKDEELTNEKVLIDFRNNGERPSFGPDGMTIDAEGNLYVCTWGGSKILKIDPKTIHCPLSRFSYFFVAGAHSGIHLFSLLSIEGQVWRDRRTSLSAIFTSGKMKMMFETILILSHKLVDIIDNELNSNHNFEMRSWAQRFTGDVIGNVAFGLDCKCLDDPDSIFLKHSRRLSNPTGLDLLKFLLSSCFPDLCRRLHFRSNPKEIATFFHTAFIETMKYRTANHIDRTDFVSMLLGLKDLFTMDELAAESFIVYMGGFETSSTLNQFYNVRTSTKS
ncbi:hypothetical protein HA402_002387 [Bradysia odoriphaga]|nr:hypothetical protein HA402_002387 [Bradysia odoriphaga]